jgi:hypothetical protein
MKAPLFGSRNFLPVPFLIWRETLKGVPIFGPFQSHIVINYSIVSYQLEGTEFISPYLSVRVIICNQIVK